MSIWSLTNQQSVVKRCHRLTVTNISESFTYKTAAKINWHRYGTKLRHCHPMYSGTLKRAVKFRETTHRFSMNRIILSIERSLLKT